MVGAAVPRRWRWYQVASTLVTAVIGVTLFGVGLANGTVVVWVVGAVWFALAVYGLATLRNVAWSIQVDGEQLRLDGPRLHAAIPVSEVVAARRNGLTRGRMVLTLDTTSIGRVRFGPLPPDAAPVLAALGYANPDLASTL